jgi:hypothetical protein
MRFRSNHSGAPGEMVVLESKELFPLLGGITFTLQGTPRQSFISVSKQTCRGVQLRGTSTVNGGVTATNFDLAAQQTDPSVSQ